MPVDEEQECQAPGCDERAAWWTDDEQSRALCEEHSREHLLRSAS